MTATAIGAAGRFRTLEKDRKAGFKKYAIFGILGKYTVFMTIREVLAAGPRRRVFLILRKQMASLHS
jgi:hypothetical protein